MTTICIPTFQVGVVTDPTESPVYFEYTHRLRAFSGFRGTQAADAAVSAGTREFTLSNEDRLFDPDYEDGPLYTWIDLARRNRQGVSVGTHHQSFAGALHDGGAPSAHYSLNEPAGTVLAYDQSGGVNGAHGTYTGGAALGQAGLVGTTPDTAAGLDGTNDHIDLPDAVYFSGDLTITAWIHPTAFTSWARIADLGQGQGDDNVIFSLGNGSNGRLAFEVYVGGGSGGQIVGDVGTAVALNETTFVAARLSGTTGTLWKNGAAIKTGTTGVPANVVRNSSYLGRSNWASDGYFTGRLAHVCFYQRALSDGDLENIYLAGQGAHHERFHGYVDDIDLEPDGPLSENAVLRCSDGLAVLAGAKISGSRPQERSDERIAAILGLAEWQTGSGWVLDVSQLGLDTVLGPVGDQVLDAGQVEVQADELSGTALPAIQEVERSEHGRFFCGRDGAMVFHGRNRRLQAAVNDTGLVFGDRPDEGELPYVTAPARRYSRAVLHNIVSITRINGTEQERSDQASIDRYWPNELPPYSVSLVTDDETGYLADYELGTRKDRRPVLPELALDPDGAPAALAAEHVAAIFDRELFDVFTHRRRPVDLGDSLDFLVEVVGMREGWAIDEQGARWDIGWSLALADPGPYWVLDDPTYSVLGLTTRLSI
jgi:hypothetical protein